MKHTRFVCLIIRKQLYFCCLEFSFVLVDMFARNKIYIQFQNEINNFYDNSKAFANAVYKR